MAAAATARIANAHAGPDVSGEKLIEEADIDRAELFPEGHRRASTMSQAMRNASHMAPGAADPFPTMSKAVPCAGVVMIAGRPPATVTPRSKPSSFIAICPWS